MHTILVADDSVTIQKAVAIVFDKEPFKVVTAATGAEAVQRAKELKPHIVITDHTMPDRSGYDLADALKADPSTAQIPVLLLSSSAAPFDEARARAAGIVGHVPKPFDCQTLLERVRAAVGAPAIRHGSFASAAPAPAAASMPRPPGLGGGLPRPPTTNPGVQARPAPLPTPAAPAGLGSGAPKSPPRAPTPTPARDLDPFGLGAASASSPAPSSGAPAPLPSRLGGAGGSRSGEGAPVAARPAPPSVPSQVSASPNPFAARPPSGLNAVGQPGVSTPSPRPASPPGAPRVDGARPGAVAVDEFMEVSDLEVAEVGGAGRTAMAQASVAPAPVPTGLPRTSTGSSSAPRPRPDPSAVTAKVDAHHLAALDAQFNGDGGPRPSAPSPGAAPSSPPSSTTAPRSGEGRAVGEPTTGVVAAGAARVAEAASRTIEATTGAAPSAEALSAAAREIVERIAWEVVPELAETIIREEIQRLLKER
jgi:CheY-like chemotaxis protein